MKKLTKIAAAGLMIGIMSLNFAYAAPKIEYGSFQLAGKAQRIALANVSIDGNRITAKAGEVPPLVMNQRTLVPVGLVAQSLGATVDWNGRTEEVTVTKDSKKIVLKINSPTATVNGVKKDLPDKVAPIIVDSRTMVPLAFISNEFNLEIAYDAATNSVNMKTKTVIGEIDDLFDNEGSNQGGSPLDNLDLTGVDVIGTPVEEPSVVLPETPVVPDTTVPVAPALPQGINQVIYSLNQVSMDNEIFNISSALSRDFTYDSFFLSGPERLVIDINQTALSQGQDSNKLYPSSGFIKEMRSHYYPAENKVRLTLELKGDVKREEIALKKSGASLQVEYKSQKPKNSNIGYSSDRINSQFTLRLNGAFPVQGLTKDAFSNTVEFSIPKANANLQNEIRNINDRNIKSIEIIERGQENIVRFKLEDRVEHFFMENGLSGSILIKFAKQNRDIPLIVVDAGHGGKDPGAVNKAHNMTEKALNLSISQKLAQRLRQEGYNIITTRDTDVFIELAERGDIANNNDVDLFISIHFNAAGNTSARGIETLYHPTEDGKKVAQIFQTEIVKASGAPDRKIIPRSNLSVLRRTKMPAVLLELGYMTNPTEIVQVMDDSYQNKLVDGIVNAVNRYFKEY